MSDTKDAPSDFAVFRERMGFNLKGIGKAGALIGLEPHAARLRHRDGSTVTATERLAMAAVVAGLPAYRPDLHDNLGALKNVVAASDDLHRLSLHGRAYYEIAAQPPGDGEE